MSPNGYPEIPLCFYQAPLRAHEIARHPRVEAVTWGAEDLSSGTPQALLPLEERS